MGKIDMEITTDKADVSIMSSHTDTNKPVVQWFMTIDVKGHTLVRGAGGCCTEKWRVYITAPRTAELETTTRETRNKEAGIE